MLVFSWRQINISFFQNLLWAHEEAGGGYVVEASPLENTLPPKIDGKLDDIAWKLTKPVSGFIQKEPHRGEPATDDTEVRILYDRHYLYLGFRCYDASPEKIVNRVVRRGRRFDTDMISFFLDSYHDHRTGYYFATSPSGIQTDAYRYDDSKADFSWRGIWWAEGHIDELGWTAEFKIPFSNFRFPNQQKLVWGINFERLNRRKNEFSVWKLMLQAGNWTRMSELGHLVGIEAISAGKAFEISPYLLSGFSENFDSSMERQLDLGLNVQYSVTGTLKTNATINPDFAQVEADQLEINLTRFPTRFEEKRPFFVEGNSIFQTPLELFYSRRIGSRGNIIWGTKATGKLGDYSIGFIGSRTRRFNALELGEESRSKEGALYSVLRLKRDIFNRSNIGFLIADKELDSAGYTRVGGLDTNLVFYKNYQLVGQYAMSFQPNKIDKNKAYLVELAQSNFIWNGIAGFQRVEPLFELNETGFLRKEEYRGWQQAFLSVDYIHHSNQGAQRTTFGVEGKVSQSLYTDEYFINWKNRYPDAQLSSEFSENLSSWKGSVWGSLRFLQSLLDRFSVIYSRSREIELTDVLMVNEYSVFVSTNQSRRAWGGLSLLAGDFYNFTKRTPGVQRQLSLFGTLRPRSNLTLEFSSSYVQSLNQENIIDGRFFVSSLRTTYLFNRNTFLRGFVQAERQRTFYDKIQTYRNYFLSLLLGWEYSPKSNIFVAYNESWRTEKEKFQLDNRVLVFKISYLWNP